MKQTKIYFIPEKATIPIETIKKYPASIREVRFIQKSSNCFWCSVGRRGTGGANLSEVGLADQNLIQI